MAAASSILIGVLAVGPAMAQDAEECADASCEEEQQGPTTGRYIGGGILGTFGGFGTGHAVHGTYSEFGWVFTLSEGLAAVAAIACWTAKTWAAQPETWAIAALAGAGLVLLIHGWEIVDVWVRGYKRTYGSSSAQKEGGRSLAVLPAPLVMENGGGLGLSGRF